MSINEMLLLLVESQMDLHNIHESFSGFHDPLMHLRHKISAVFPGPKRFIRGAMLYPPLNFTGDLDEFIKYGRQADLSAWCNSYPLVGEGKMSCSLCSPVQWFQFSQAHVVWRVPCKAVLAPWEVNLCSLSQADSQTFTSVRWDTCGTAIWELGIHPCGPFKSRMQTSGVCSQINLCCENASGVCCRPQLSIIFPWTSCYQMWGRCSVPMERWHLLCPSLRIILEGRWSRVGPVNCCNGRSLSQHASTGSLLGLSWAWQAPSCRRAFCTYTAADLYRIGNSSLMHSVGLCTWRLIDLFWVRGGIFYLLLVTSFSLWLPPGTRGWLWYNDL